MAENEEIEANVRGLLYGSQALAVRRVIKRGFMRWNLQLGCIAEPRGPGCVYYLKLIWTEGFVANKPLAATREWAESAARSRWLRSFKSVVTAPAVFGHCRPYSSRKARSTRLQPVDNPFSTSRFKFRRLYSRSGSLWREEAGQLAGWSRRKVDELIERGENRCEASRKLFSIFSITVKTYITRLTAVSKINLRNVFDHQIAEIRFFFWNSFFSVFN